MRLIQQTIFLLILFFVSFIGCVRQSGRKAPTSSTEISQTDPDRNGRNRRDQSNKSVQVQTVSQKKMSGIDIFKKYNSAVFMVFTSDGLKGYQGSGFFISRSGIAVSNYHVFEGTTIGFEQIKLSDNRIYNVKSIIVRNQEHDFIIFQVDGGNTQFNYIPIEQKRPQVGEKVFAIGSPLGLENTFSSGEISQVRGNDLIQISAPIDHGSSGGALINEYGNVIGITTGGLESAANLNFAINIDLLKPYLK